MAAHRFAVCDHALCIGVTGTRGVHRRIAIRTVVTSFDRAIIFDTVALLNSLQTSTALGATVSMAWRHFVRYNRLIE